MFLVFVGAGDVCFIGDVGAVDMAKMLVMGMMLVTLGRSW